MSVEDLWLGPHQTKVLSERFFLSGRVKMGADVSAGEISLGRFASSLTSSGKRLLGSTWGFPPARGHRRNSYGEKQTPDIGHYRGFSGTHRRAARPEWAFYVLD
jgi:hypothetical protein